MIVPTKLCKLENYLDWLDNQSPRVRLVENDRLYEGLFEFYSRARGLPKMLFRVFLGATQRNAFRNHTQLNNSEEKS